jgi:uncharacterized protein (TIGR02117 family)
MRAQTLAWLFCLAAVCGCAAGRPATESDAEETHHRIWVAASGWHAAIVLSRPDVAATRLLPEAADFPSARYLEFGWGDRRYYTAEDKSLGLALAAALAPSPSVLHVAGFSQEPESIYEKEKLLSLELTAAEWRRLLQSISADVERRGAARAEPLSEGLWPDSRFYAARGDFHFFNTCNTWVAEKLRAAELPVASYGVITAGDLMTRLGAPPALERAFSP